MQFYLFMPQLKGETPCFHQAGHMPFKSPARGAENRHFCPRPEDAAAEMEFETG